MEQLDLGNTKLVVSYEMENDIREVFKSKRPGVHLSVNEEGVLNILEGRFGSVESAVEAVRAEAKKQGKQIDEKNIGEIQLWLNEEVLDQVCEVAMRQIASELNITLKRSETGNKSWILVGPFEKIKSTTEQIKNFFESKQYTRVTQEGDNGVIKVFDSDTGSVLSWDWLGKAILNFYFLCGEFVQVNHKECILKGSYNKIESCLQSMKSWIENCNQKEENGKQESKNANNIENENADSQQRTEQQNQKKRHRELAANKTESPTLSDDKNEQKFFDLDIEQHVWFYMLAKYGSKISTISADNNCSIGPVENEKKHRIRFKPSLIGNMDKAMDEFASLYQEVDGKGIEKCCLPITDVVKTKEVLSKREVYFKIDCEVICPRAEMEEIKRIVADVNGIAYPGKTNPKISNNSSTEGGVFYEFDAPSGIHVKISQGNLVRQRTVAIVNPANERLGNGGGAARAIEDAAGYDLRRECDEFINRHGKLPTTGVTHTCGGKLPCAYVVHAVGPDSHSSRYKDNKELVYDDLKKTFYNCFHYANSKTEKDLQKGTIKSISIPAISSGIYGVPKEKVANAAFDALMKFDEYYQKSPKYLREINFVNNDEPTVMAMMEVFRSRNEKFQQRREEEGSSVNGPMKISLEIYSQAENRKVIHGRIDVYSFPNAVATALESDFPEMEITTQDQVMKKIKEEMKRNKERYEKYFVQESTVRKYWNDFLENVSFWPRMDENLDVYINALAEALDIDITVFQQFEQEGERTYHPSYKGGVSRKEIKLICRQNAVHGRVFFAHVKNKDDSEEYDSSSEQHKGSKSGDKSYQNSHDENSAAGKSQKNGTEPNHGSQQPEKDYKGARPKEKRQLIHPTVEDEYDKLSESELDHMRKEGDESKKNKLTNGQATADPGKEDNYCVICMDSITDPVNLPCKHKFCRECLDGYKAKCQPKCPSCGIPYGEMKGDQPKGTMNVRELPWQHLSGFEKAGTLEISYHFPDGTQKSNHPEPGKSYRGTSRTAYLPANKEGREVLELLRRAFDNDLLFTIGRSNTTGRENVVIWNDVHQKTSLNGQYGYPDPTYLTRVKEELAAKGIRPK